MKYSDKAYTERIARLFEQHQSVQSSGFTPDAFHPGLENMLAVDAAMGHPWRQYRCIHVAGTNGKGSVCSMLAAALATTGLRVGLFTSPHLLDFRERIKVVSGGSFELIPKAEVWNFLESVDVSALSFFEITAAMAFGWFAKAGVDVAVIEVGLGGRLDSTNIITPELSVITSIGLDHCAILGGTRPLIAAEKAGIFKPSIPALVWGHDAETGPVFGKVAKEVGCELMFADSAALGSVHGYDLRGEYEAANLRTAKAALTVLGIDSAAPAIEDALRHTAAITGLRGRWEILLHKPEVVCDIGHNPPALKENFAQLEADPRPLTIIYGIMADKALDDIAPLFPSRANYILCAPSTARALPAEALASRIATLRPDLRCTVSPTVSAAVRQAISSASPDSLIYIGGSTFVVAEAIEFCEIRKVGN